MEKENIVLVPIQDVWVFKTDDQHKRQAEEKDLLDDFINLLADILFLWEA